MFGKNQLNHRLKGLAKVTGLFIAVFGVLYTGMASAAAGSSVTLSDIAGTVGGSVSQLATILIDVALITGIGFIMASFFKFHQHKLNPNQVSMTQGISLLLIGCGLTLVPLIIPTASMAILGSKAEKPAQINGAEIKKLIGGTTTGPK